MTKFPGKMFVRTIGRLTEALAAMARPFAHRNYRLFFAGQLVSLTGTWMQRIALSWLVYRLTGSAVLLGVAPSPNRCRCSCWPPSAACWPTG
jgi:hypothetical protein